MQEERPKDHKFKEVMDSLRGDLQQLRKDNLEESDDYKLIKEDNAYQTLLDEGDFTKNDYELEEQRLYPSLENAKIIWEEHKAQHNNQAPFSWKSYQKNQSVFVKEFLVPEEELKQDLLKLKSPTGTKLSRITEIKSQLPEAKKTVEEYIGENLISKVALIVMFLGLCILYRYGINEGNISEGWRIFTGIFLGGAMFVIGHFILKERDQHIDKLVSLGIIFLHYTLYLSNKDYHILSLKPAIIINILIAFLFILLAVFYNRKKLLQYAIIGAFLSPLLIAENETYYQYFSYILVLNFTIFPIAYFKSWKKISYWSAFLSFSSLIYWMQSEGFGSRKDYTYLIIFVTSLYLIFFANIMIYALKAKVTFSKKDMWFHGGLLFFHLIIITFGLAELGNLHKLSYFLLGLGLYCLVYTNVIYNHPQANQRLRNTLISSILFYGISAGFLAFSGKWIHLYLSFCAVIVLWSGNELKNNFLRHVSLQIFALSLISMIWMWAGVYFSNEPHDFIANRGFLASFITLCTIAIYLYQYVDVKDQMEIISFVPVHIVEQWMGILVLFTIYFGGLFEIISNADYVIASPNLRHMLISLYNMLFILTFRFVIYEYYFPKLKPFIKVMMSLVVGSYLFYGHPEANQARDAFIQGDGYFVTFLFHYINVAVSVFIVYLLFKDQLKVTEDSTKNRGNIIYFTTLLFTLHFSFEFENLIVLLRSGLFDVSVTDSSEQIRLTGYTILWSFIAIAFMVMGVLYKIKELRISSFILFSITILKFSFIDFWRLNTIPQIISLFTIGTFMYFASKMYSKLKKLVKEGEIDLSKIQKIKNRIQKH